MNKIIGTIQSFSITARTIFYFLSIVFIISGIGILWRINNHFLVKTPQAGGTEVEGVIGVPQFINPLLATTDAEKDITALVYSGLMKRDRNGNIVPDLAESYTISPDGKTYTFNLKKNIFFEDNTPLTANDVFFTVQKVQDPVINSPIRAAWQGVTVATSGDYQVVFTLQQPYAPFLENTTLGILPEHIWSTVGASQFSDTLFNTKPIGSGIYKLKSVEKSADVPTSYTLTPFTKSASGKAYISDIVFKFYPDEQTLINAYQSGAVQAINSITPEAAEKLVEKGFPVATSTLPRTFAVFFNQTDNPALQDNAVRQALDLSVDREYIVDTALQGFATPLTGPLPTSFLSTTATSTSTINLNGDLTLASAILDKAGWKVNAQGFREKTVGKTVIPLRFSITTTDAAELREVAETLQNEWRNIGAQVDIKIFEGGYLHQNIIRTRTYEALLFGEVVNRDLDLLPFWDSSQRVDPGLNVSSYADSKSDTLLEALRREQDPDTRTVLYTALAARIASSTPAIFLYAPDFMYFVPKQTEGVDIGGIVNPSDRFSNVSEWFITTANIWKVFLSKNK